MAIDTTNDKLALIHFQQVWQPPLPISSDGIGQADQQSLLWGYPGILWTEIVGVVTIAFDVVADDSLSFDSTGDTTMDFDSEVI